MIIALSGGVGGAKLALGPSRVLRPEDLLIVVNTGDDFEHLGLSISPDIDTVTYTLAGLANRELGWGRQDETWSFMETMEVLGGETWFRLGDLDLGLHLRRRELIDAGEPSSAITAELARRLGIDATVLPMTDDPVETWVQLAEDRQWVHFQEYFVKRRTNVAIRGVRFEGIERARPAPGLLDAVASADLIAFCPSNPIVSLAPVLAVPGLRDALRDARKRGAVIGGISPLIGGATVKGPAARMLGELGHKPTAAGVATLYDDLLDVFQIDPLDRGLSGEIQARTVVADGLMRGRRGEARLARVLLRACLGAPEGAD